MHKKRLSLKKAYFLVFAGLIVIPTILVLVIALVVLSNSFRRQAVENIERAQDTVITEFLSDIDFMSMRLSQLVNTNDNEIINYAAQTDCTEGTERYKNQQNLESIGNLILEPVKDIVSVGFYMKDGKSTYIKNDIKRSQEELRSCQWYQDALDFPNSVKVGLYQTRKSDDLYVGGRKDLLVASYAVSPNRMIDRSGLIEMVVFYQTMGAGNSIRKYNRDYASGNNQLGIMQIVDGDGQVRFATEEAPQKSASGYTWVRTPVRFGENEWYIESYIRTRELTSEFNRIGGAVILAAAFILILSGCYAEYFLKKIIKPVGELSEGLKQVEDGNLDIHIAPAGQFEIRGAIHRFNAMVRSLRALIEDYEERVRSAGKTPHDYLASMIRGEMTPEQVNHSCAEFFQDSYVIIGMNFEQLSGEKINSDMVKQMLEGFERNPRYTARCVSYIESTVNGFLFYRVTEEDYLPRVTGLLEELQAYGRREHGIGMDVVISEKCHGYAAFTEAVRNVTDYAGLRFLYGECAVVSLASQPETWKMMRDSSEKYQRLSDYLYAADEKNYTAEKEKLFEDFGGKEPDKLKTILYAVIISVAGRFYADGIRLVDIFGKKYNYVDKIDHLEDAKSMKMWMTNWMAWILDYSAGKLDEMETDVIVKAKRYLADHYDDADLTLACVADHVGLNEKYFSNRFTKETGETFSSYLTETRIQKAKELLRTTTFKVYEVAEMVGYHNAEHFNRMFKKVSGVSPAQYRKQSSI